MSDHCRNVIVMAFSEAERAEKKDKLAIPANMRDIDGWHGCAVFPRGGPPHHTPGCHSKREALARAAAEGRMVWRAFRARQNNPWQEWGRKAVAS